MLTIQTISKVPTHVHNARNTLSCWISHKGRSRLCSTKTSSEMRARHFYHIQISTRETSSSSPKTPQSSPVSLTGSRPRWSRRMYSPPRHLTLQRSYQSKKSLSKPPTKTQLRVKLLQTWKPTSTFASGLGQSCRRYVRSCVKPLSWMTPCFSFYQRQVTGGWTTLTPCGQCFRTSNKSGLSLDCLEKAATRRPKRRPKHWKLVWIGGRLPNGSENFSQDSLDVTTTAGLQRIAGNMFCRIIERYTAASLSLWLRVIPMKTLMTCGLLISAEAEQSRNLHLPAFRPTQRCCSEELPRYWPQPL
jgi:hypothetical protein